MARLSFTPFENGSRKHAKQYLPRERSLSGIPSRGVLGEDSIQGLLSYNTQLYTINLTSGPPVLDTGNEGKLQSRASQLQWMQHLGEYLPFVGPKATGGESRVPLCDAFVPGIAQYYLLNTACMFVHPFELMTYRASTQKRGRTCQNRSAEI